MTAELQGNYNMCRAVFWLRVTGCVVAYLATLGVFGLQWYGPGGQVIKLRSWINLRNERKRKR